MRFRICCCCSPPEDGKRKSIPNEVSETNVPTVSAIVAEQPKLSHQIQLDRITEISVEESSVQAVGENVVATPPISTPEPQTQIQNDLKPNVPSPPKQFPVSTPESQTQIHNDPKSNVPLPPKQFPVGFNAMANISYSTDVNGEKIDFQQIQPNVLLGSYRDGQFKIKDGVLISTEGSYTQTDKDQIMSTFVYLATELEKNLETGLDPHTGQPKVGTTLNVNIQERNGEKYMLPLYVAGPDHYRSTYRGIHFAILNGRIMASNKDDDYKLDKEMLLTNFKIAMQGFQMGLSGSGKPNTDTVENPLRIQLPPHIRAMTDFSFTTNIRGEEVTFRQIEPGVFAGTYKNGRFMLRDGELISTQGPYTQLDKDAIVFAYIQSVTSMDTKARGFRAEPNPNAEEPEADWQENCIRLLRNLEQNPDNKDIVYEQILKELNSRTAMQANLSVPNSTTSDPPSFDLEEPVLKKTTYTPKETVYEDPKKYEPQDKNEMVIKRLDELIISRDDNSGSGNRCYFHEARPRRVNRKKLGAKQQLRLASPERYTLFQMQCLKEHNAYRKLHGVPPLVHNEFLCEVATEWAEHLALKDAFYHRPNNDFGENLYFATKDPYPARKAVKAWYDEIELYDYNNPKFSKETGHFTQLIWKDTREMGTGAAIVGDKMYVCCNYNPPGNCMGKFNDEYVPRPVVVRVRR